MPQYIYLHLGVLLAFFQHVIVAKAVAFGEALNDDFKDYQNQVIKNAQALAQTLIKQDLTHHLSCLDQLLK